MTADTAQSAETIHRIIGTAGHVDHGKSSLVKALTGTDPDRLAEEKARAMTIDLGFAWKVLPDGARLSFIDVPGHERFIKNMLAGVGGIDAVLLVIAADEGPMPQTREHLAIINLLRISNGVIALTKADLADPEWLDLVTAETRAALDGSTLAGAPIIPCSVVSGLGIDAVEQALIGQMRQAPGHADLGRPRLTIDRVFTLAGFGTVVTGTLIDGSLRVGEEVVLLPDVVSSRIRGLHVHNARVDRAEPGTRVAVNLTGVSLDQVRRGDLLAHPDTLTLSQRIDVKLDLLPDAPAPLKQDDRVDLFTGATETAAWLTLLDQEQIEPGQSGWVQLRLRRAVALVNGDRFIIRRPSPSDTIGGGIVIDPAPLRHGRFREDVIAGLASRERGDPAELILRFIANRIATVAELERLIQQEDVLPIVRALVDRDAAITIGRSHVTSRHYWSRLRERSLEAIAAFHTANPLQKGIPREELRRRIGVEDAGALDQLIAELALEGLIVNDLRTLRLSSFAITLDPAQRENADRWIAAIDAAPFSPPAPDTFAVTRESISALQARDEIIVAGDGIAFTPAALAIIEAAVGEMFDDSERINLAGYRDRFATSRKYAQATLELLDQRRVTRRIGDDRVRYRPAATRGGET